MGLYQQLKQGLTEENTLVIEEEEKEEENQSRPLSLYEQLKGMSSPDITRKPKPVFSADTDELGILDSPDSLKTYTTLRKDKAIQEAAKRFTKQHLGEDDLSGEDAFDEVISHFRSFNVNELTAASDLRYVSAAKSDSESGESYAEDAKQRLEDYRTVYNAFNALPDFYEEGGAPAAFSDYGSGILTAPSTYVGLILPGAGKAAGISASVAAKTTVARLLNAAASRPVLTTALVEGGAGALQNIAAQKTELEADLKDDYSLAETGLVAGVSAALPAAITLNAVKRGAGKIIDSKTPDILTEALAKQTEAREKAASKAQETIKNNKGKADIIKKNLDALDPERVAKGEAEKAKIASDAGIADAFTVTLDRVKADTIIAATLDVSLKAKTKLEKNERVSAFLARSFNSLRPEKAEEIAGDVMSKYNLTQDDFSNLLLADFSEAGKKLQSASKLREILNAADTVIFNVDAEAKQLLGRTVKTAEESNPRNFLEKTGEGIRALDTLRLSFMTSQVATTFRNTVSGFARVGLFDLPTKLLDRSIATVMRSTGMEKLTGKASKGFLEFGPNNDSFAIVAGLSNRKRTNAIIELFKSNYPRQSGRLFRELADLEVTNKQGPLTTGLRRVGREFNSLNTISDNFFKGAAFVGELERALNEKYALALRANVKNLDISDYNLTDIARKGNLNKLFQGKEGKELLDDVISKTLFFTYQRSPQKDAGKLLVNAMNKVPFVTTSFMPFPRFVYNALRFTYEYSPFYLFTGARKALAKDVNNYEELSKGLIGLGFYNAAMAFRQSEYAGENWYEGKTADGKTYDLRPFFPAAPFLFFADVVNKYNEGKLEQLDKNVILSSLQALTGTQMRAGFGLYALDNALLDLASAKEDDQRIKEILANFAANIASTYTIPFTVAQDLDNTFLAPDDARLARQTNVTDIQSLIIAKSLARLPRNYRIEELLSDYLGTNPSEVYESPTRAEPIRRDLPILRQTSGVLLRERKNVLEKELDRLKIRRNELFQKTAVPEANQLISMFFGEFSSNYLIPKVIKSDYYKSLDDMGKRKYILANIRQFRAEILDNVRDYSRTYGEFRYGFDPVTKADFLALDPYYRDMAIENYERISGESFDKTDVKDVDEVIKAARYFKNNQQFKIE